MHGAARNGKRRLNARKPEATTERGPEGLIARFTLAVAPSSFSRAFPLLRQGEREMANGTLPDRFADENAIGPNDHGGRAYRSAPRNKRRLWTWDESDDTNCDHPGPVEADESPTDEHCSGREQRRGRCLQVGGHDVA